MCSDFFMSAVPGNKRKSTKSRGAQSHAAKKPKRTKNCCTPQNPQEWAAHRAATIHVDVDATKML